MSISRGPRGAQPGRQADDHAAIAQFAQAACISLAANGVGIVLVHGDGRLCLDATSQAKFGIMAEASASDVLARVPPSERRLGRQWIAASFHEAVAPIEISILDAGQRSWRVRLAVAPVGPSSQAVVVSITDISTLHALLDAQARENDHLRYTVELNPELPWIAEPDGSVIEFTDRWLAMTGLTREDAIGNGWARVIHADDVADTTAATQKAVATGDPFDVRFRATLADRSVRWMRARGLPRRDDNGRILRWYGYTEDIHEIVLVEQSIQWNADHDPLTGLPNRSLFTRHLEQAMRRQRRADEQLVLLLIDIDNFKDVNDVLGHDAGDALLDAFSVALVEAFPHGSIVARIGGDEFAVLLELAAEHAEIERTCLTLFARLKDKVVVSGHSMVCRASIGASAYPQHGMTPTELFKNADIALYASKNGGRGRLTVFHPDMLRQTQERVAMINLARRSATDRSIVAYYQPQVAFEDGRLVGFEALLRRKDRRGGVHLPGSLAAAFEDLDVAEALGDAMLDCVIADMTRWRNQALPIDNVAINVSTAELRHEAFAERLVNRLDRASIPYSNLTIEVTEGVFLGRSAASALHVIGELSRLGFPIALDDFGTGYASLSHLRQIPVDTLKIDRSFISELTGKQDDRAIVSAVIQLGESLGMKVVAEGIETIEQATVLRAMGCKYAQGFLCSYPTPPQDIPELVRNWRARDTFLADASWDRGGELFKHIAV